VEVLYLIIPLSILLVMGIGWIFMWSVKSGQFDDLEGPAHRLIMEDDEMKSNKSLDESESDSTKSKNTSLDDSKKD